MDNKLEFKIGEEIFVSFKDDNEIIKTGFFYFIKLTDQAVMLRSKDGNILLFPMHRVLKLKQREVKNG